MTQPGAVRVTVARACATCNGTGAAACWRCHGKGVVWEPVTCVGCRNNTTRAGLSWCVYHEDQIASDFACAAWEPREP